MRIDKTMSITVSDPVQFRHNVTAALFETFFQPDEDNKSKDKKALNEKALNEKALNEKATAVEESIYRFAAHRCQTVYKIPPQWTDPSFVQLYTGRFRSLFHNLKHEPAFLKRVRDGSIGVAELENMRHIEMSETKWAPYIQQLLEREMYTQNQNENRATSDMFVCPNCSSTRSTFYSLQTRGGDEPMTIFVNCADCNYKWTE